MAISYPFNDSYTSNNNSLITIYVILRTVVSIGNWYLHFCKRQGGRVLFVCLFFCNYTVIAHVFDPHS